MATSAEIPVGHEVLSAGLSKHRAASRGNAGIETATCTACAHPVGRAIPAGAEPPGAWVHLIESSSQSGHAPSVEPLPLIPRTTPNDKD